MAEPKKKGFGDLINITTTAFGASTAESEASYPEDAPKMVNNRQSVYRVPLSMIRPDRFQARFMLPYELREDFFSQKAGWAETVRRWLKLAEHDRLIRREIEELIALGDSLHDTGQIKPVTGQGHIPDADRRKTVLGHRPQVGARRVGRGTVRARPD